LRDKFQRNICYCLFDLVDVTGHRRPSGHRFSGSWAYIKVALTWALSISAALRGSRFLLFKFPWTTSVNDSEILILIQAGVRCVRCVHQLGLHFTPGDPLQNKVSARAELSRRRINRNLNY